MRYVKRLMAILALLGAQTQAHAGEITLYGGLMGDLSGGAVPACTTHVYWDERDADGASRITGVQDSNSLAGRYGIRSELWTNRKLQLVAVFDHRSCADGSDAELGTTYQIGVQLEYRFRIDFD